MAASLELQRVHEWNTLRGFGNLFRKENQAWWGTRRGWLNLLLWPALLGGLLTFVAFVLPAMSENLGQPLAAEYGGPAGFGLALGLTSFFEFGSVAIALGIIILCQDLVIGEKQAGVTEWLLSKPVARRSYILAKLAATLAVVLIAVIGIPAALAYGLFSLRIGSPYPLTPFIAGVGIMTLHSLFYLTLTLTLSTLVNSRVLILGIALGSVFGGTFLGGMLKPLVSVTPWILVKGSSLVAAGNAVPEGLLTAPILTTALWCVNFTVIAVVGFEKAEF